MELLDSAPVGVCVLIRSNTVGNDKKMPENVILLYDEVRGDALRLQYGINASCRADK